MSMFLHRTAKTRTLRSKAASRCKYCGTPIEWFESYDARPIPLTNEFPSRRIPAKLRWHIEQGIAYPGTDASSPYCRIPHPAICPAVEHTDLPPAIQELVRLLSVRMRTAIDQGEFSPFAEPVTPEEVENPEPEKTARIRHVIAYSGTLRIGPCAIEDLQCISTDRRTRRRCKYPVCDLGEGRWQPVSINEEQAAGRLGQMVLSLTGGTMWAWNLVDFTVAIRWWRQHCHEHHNSSQPDHVRCELVPFHALRHSEYILTDRPAEDPPGPEATVVIHEGPIARTKCSNAPCSNTSVIDHPDNWLCWECAKRERRRALVHQRWVRPPQETSGPGTGR
ncbi:DUF6083 domain-containing protein [Streptomyces rubiginosohelvolus]|uniref:DUF6083 domain-containing protein n=1 Tax=Streptomyces rubiginosohelvolus TaxID=67362 RepID=UPI0035E32D5F